METPDDLPWLERCSPSPGLTVARRGFFGAAAAAFATAALPGSSTSWQHRRGQADWTIEQFVREVAPVARELLADTSARGQDRYLLTLAAFAVRLGLVPVPESREVGPGHRIGSNHGPEPFTVLHWQLAPHAEIRPHAHTYGNVVTLGLTGSARVRNYEQVGAPTFDSPEPIEVVCVQEQVLRPGDINLVSLERHYVHGFVAGPAGASGLDITTRVVPRRATPELEIDKGQSTGTAGAPVDEPVRVKARWRVGD